MRVATFRTVEDYSTEESIAKRRKASRSQFVRGYPKSIRSSTIDPEYRGRLFDYKEKLSALQQRMYFQHEDIHVELAALRLEYADLI